MRQTTLFLFLVFVILSAMIRADELAPASRFDVSLSPYKFELQGELSRTLKNYRKSVNQTGIELSRDRQVRAETTRLKQLLDSRGYYQAAINSAYDEERQKPRYEIQLGERFTISEIDITGSYIPSDNTWRRLKVGDALNAVEVLAERGRLRTYIGEQDCFFQYSVDHQVELDQTTRSGKLTFITKTSTPAVFGEVVFKTQGLNEEFLRRVAGLSKGACYQRAEIDLAVISLFDTGLFAQVRPEVSLQPDNSVNVTFVLAKRSIRTISAGVGFETEIGPQLNVGWQHRNLLGSAQSLNLGLALQPNSQSASVGLVVPSFYDRRNRLNWLNKIERVNDEFEFYEFSSTATLERQASRRDYFEYGLGFNQLNLRDDMGWTNYRQVRVPLKYQFDSVGDPFNPSAGYRYSIGIEPIFDIDENFTPFMITGFGVQNFLPLDSRLTLASRVKFESIWYGGLLGSSLDNIPGSEWFKVGGSTTIRGYSFESIGLENSSKPGASQRWLVTNEARLRLTDTWGAVGFVDAGAVGIDVNPANLPNWYLGAGGGVRFFTRFAPIRFDIAVPLNARPDDSRFLIYVSLGQAF